MVIVSSDKFSCDVVLNILTIFYTIALKSIESRPLFFTDGFLNLLFAIQTITLVLKKKKKILKCRKTVCNINTTNEEESVVFFLFFCFESSRWIPTCLVRMATESICSTRTVWTTVTRSDNIMCCVLCFISFFLTKCLTNGEERKRKRRGGGSVVNICSKRTNKNICSS